MALSTESLIRRVLCPQVHGTLTESQTPLEQLLPPLTSSNAVDLQLYAIIAIVMRDFVYSWYGKITSDQTFVEETIRIIAHCTRELEKRLRKVDLEVVLLHEICDIVQLHIKAFRTVHSQHPSPDASDPEILYHNLFPHPALSPAPAHGLSTVEQVKNEVAYRQLLVQSVLVVLLPTEDLRNPCLRTLVSDIIADMILGNGVGGKASSGWLMWDGIAKALDHDGEIPQQTSSTYELRDKLKTHLETFQLVSPDQEHGIPANNHRSGDRTVSAMFWRVLQYFYLTVIGFRYVLSGLWIASRSTSSNPKPLENSRTTFQKASPITTKLEPLSLNHSTRRPMLSYSVFGLLSQLLELQNRVPWITGWLSLIRYHLVDGILHVGATGAILDKFLHNCMQQQLQRPDLVPQLLRAVRTAIFPNNALGPARPIPTLKEQRYIKRRAANAILDRIPLPIASLYLAKNASNFEIGTMSISSKDGSMVNGDSSQQMANLMSPSTYKSSKSSIPDPDLTREAQLLEIESVLDLFSNQYMNKHMIYSIIELIVVRLIPELQTISVKELLDERLGTG